MKIQIISDLHLEYGGLDHPQASDADLVILAGDIHIGLKGVVWAIESFTVPVIMVFGNHDHYGESNAYPSLLNRAKELTRGTHVTILENEITEMEGVLFVGCTLWTNFELHGNPLLDSRRAMDNILDFDRIYIDGENRKILPMDMSGLHFESRRFLSDLVGMLSEKKTVLVFHYSPTSLSIKDEIRGNSLNPAFASRTDDIIMDINPVLVVHGHTHTSFDYIHPGCDSRIVCNPRGYKEINMLNPEFELKKVVEIG